MKPEHAEFLRRSADEWRSGFCTIAVVLIIGALLLFATLLISGAVVIALAVVGALLGHRELADDVFPWVWLVTFMLVVPSIIGSHYNGLCSDPWGGAGEKIKGE